MKKHILFLIFMSAIIGSGMLFCAEADLGVTIVAIDEPETDDGPDMAEEQAETPLTPVIVEPIPTEPGEAVPTIVVEPEQTDGSGVTEVQAKTQSTPVVVQPIPTKPVKEAPAIVVVKTEPEQTKQTIITEIQKKQRGFLRCVESTEGIYAVMYSHDQPKINLQEKTVDELVTLSNEQCCKSYLKGTWQNGTCSTYTGTVEDLAQATSAARKKQQKWADWKTLMCVREGAGIQAADFQKTPNEQRAINLKNCCKKGLKDATCLSYGRKQEGPDPLKELTKLNESAPEAAQASTALGMLNCIKYNPNYPDTNPTPERLNTCCEQSYQTNNLDDCHKLMGDEAWNEINATAQGVPAKESVIEARYGTWSSQNSYPEDANPNARHV